MRWHCDPAGDAERTSAHLDTSEPSEELQGTTGGRPLQEWHGLLRATLACYSAATILTASGNKALGSRRSDVSFLLVFAARDTTTRQNRVKDRDRDWAGYDWHMTVLPRLCVKPQRPMPAEHPELHVAELARSTLLANGVALGPATGVQVEH